MKSTWCEKSLIVSLIAFSTAPAFAQSSAQRSRTAGRASDNSSAANAPAAAHTGEGLESLDDNRLMNELANRGLDTLLDHFLEVNHVPQAQRQGLLTLKALHELSNPSKPLSASERQRRVKVVVDGLAAALPTIKDPQQLMQAAGTIMDNGVIRDVNTLEYWGDNPATQARLRPMAKAVMDLMGQASTQAEAQANAIAAKMNVSNQNVLGPKWEQMDGLAHNAEYRQKLVEYYLALAIPRSKDGGKTLNPERQKSADDAIEYLKKLDNAESSVQPAVRLMLGKLSLAKGDTKQAVQILGTVANDAKKEIQPAPGPSEQYEARYFRNVANIEAGDLAAAQAGLTDLLNWQQTALPKTSDVQNGVAAAAQMMQYRIHLLEAQKATDPESKKKADEAAVNVLVKLSNDRPDLRPIINQQLVERLPKNTPVGQLDPLLLQVLMAKAAAESNKPEGEAVDKDVLERGLAAAQEVITRKDRTNISPQLADESTRLVPAVLEALDRKVEAANAYLDYATKLAGVNKDAARAALDDAGRLTFQLREKQADAPGVGELQDRFLQAAINKPFDIRKQLAFLYAQRLRLQNKSKEAVQYYHLVPQDDKNYASAQFYILGAMQDLLDKKLPDAERRQLANDLVKQAEEVRRVTGTAKDDVSRARTATATLIEATIVNNDLKKPAQTLELLNGFEDLVKGLRDEKALANDALLTRVNANVGAGKLDEATKSLVNLLNETGGEQGAGLVRDLLDRLDKQFDKAEAAHDAEGMRAIAKNEADLSGFLVEWAKNNKNPDVRKFTYQYMVFDARTHRVAGTLAEDPAARDAALQKALERYQALQTPANLALYRQTLDAAKVKDGSIDPNDPDVNVQLGIAMTQYELKHYAEASKELADLLHGGKLGGASQITTDKDSGLNRVVDNDLYWDATYKLYRSNVERANDKNDPDAQLDLEGTKKGLKNLFVRGGIPAKWQDKYEALRQQIIPDFKVADLSATTQPVSVR